MESKYCKRIDSCSAPICPLYCGDIWYADQEICGSQKFKNLIWIKNQRKISKRTKDNDTYYTLRMLEHNFIIGKGIIGINPDTLISRVKAEEDLWLKHHPEKHKLNETEKAEIGLRLKRGLDLKEKRTKDRENSSFNR